MIIVILIRAFSEGFVLLRMDGKALFSRENVGLGVGEMVPCFSFVCAFRE